MSTLTEKPSRIVVAPEEQEASPPAEGEQEAFDRLEREIEKYNHEVDHGWEDSMLDRMP